MNKSLRHRMKSALKKLPQSISYYCCFDYEYDISISYWLTTSMTCTKQER